MSQPPTHDRPTPALLQAERAWQGVFQGGPYTGLKMLEYLITAGDTTPGAFLKKPKTELASAKTAIETHDIDRLAPTWQRQTGRCTSLAVKVVHTLADNKVNGELVYDWCIYDLGRHRIARCRKTGIVIDSSSTTPGGAFVLREGDWQHFPKTDASWKFQSSESKFEINGDAKGRVKRSATPISSQKAMRICLEEVADAAATSVPTLFRTVDANQTAKFWGMIAWAPATHAIKLAVNSDEMRAKNFITIQWAKYKVNKSGKVIEPEVLEDGSQGSEADLEACVQKVVSWVRTYGGPDHNGRNNGETQWAADGINTFQIALFQAAVTLWGYPKLIVPESMIGVNAAATIAATK